MSSSLSLNSFRYTRLSPDRAAPESSPTAPTDAHGHPRAGILSTRSNRTYRKGRGKKTDLDKSCTRTYTRTHTHEHSFGDNTRACQRETVPKKIPRLAFPLGSGWNSLLRDPDFLSLLHSAFTHRLPAALGLFGTGEKTKNKCCSWRSCPFPHTTWPPPRSPRLPLFLAMP